MPFISVFDVLGPNMIGPSSSHTAGACVIAFLAKWSLFCTGPLQKLIKAMERIEHCLEVLWGLVQMT